MSRTVWLRRVIISALLVPAALSMACSASPTDPGQDVAVGRTPGDSLRACTRERGPTLIHAELELDRVPALKRGSCGGSSGGEPAVPGESGPRGGQVPRARME